MTVTKSYTLTPEQQAEVDKAIAEGDAKYGPLKDIIWESPCPEWALEMFEKEMSERDDE